MHIVIVIDAISLCILLARSPSSPLRNESDFYLDIEWMEVRVNEKCECLSELKLLRAKLISPTIRFLAY